MLSVTMVIAVMALVHMVISSRLLCEPLDVKRYRKAEHRCMPMSASRYFIDGTSLSSRTSSGIIVMAKVV
jgi:hypothetical protein